MALITTENIRPHQNALLKMLLSGISPFKLIIGGVGTFKSSTVVVALLAHIIRYPGQRIIVLGSSMGALEIGFLTEWVEQIPKQLYHGKYVQGHPQINIPKFKAVIMLRQFNRPTPRIAYENIHGGSISGYVINQPDTLHDDGEYFGLLDGRVRLFGEDSYKAPEHIRWLDSNAPYTGHWLDNLFLNEKKESYLGEEPGKIGIFHVIATPETTKYPADWFKDQQKILKKSQYLRKIFGYPASTEGVIYSEWQGHNPISPEQITKIYVGFDPGSGSHPYAACFIGLHVDGYWIVFDELKETNLNLKIICGQVETKLNFWGKEKCAYFMFGWDGSAWIDYFTDFFTEEKGFEIWCVFPDRKRFFHVEDGITMVQQWFFNGKLKVANNCIETRRDLLNYVRDSKNRPDKAIHDPHNADGMRYGCCGIDEYSYDYDG